MRRKLHAAAKWFDVILAFVFALSFTLLCALMSPSIILAYVWCVCVCRVQQSADVLTQMRRHAYLSECMDVCTVHCVHVLP